MKRRSFVKQSALGAVGTLFVPQFLQGMNSVNPQVGTERKLVVVQLSGGNDGLNTIIPIENDIYYQLRPKIAITKKEALKLSDELGLNPEMGKLHELFKDGHLSVLNGVGYPNPNRSHFRSMDIWHTAVDSSEYSKTGWLGRYMDAYCNNSHAMIEVDSKLSLSLQGSIRNGLAVQESKSLYNALRHPYFKEVIQTAEATHLSEDNQGYLYKTLIETNQSAAYLAEKHTVQDNNAEFPTTQLGKKLSKVSQFIRSGLNTQVYYVSHNGFDSHVNQKNSQGRLLKEYSNAVHAFVQSLKKAGMFDNTLILTFSEFGRRVKENGSAGTDHGKANNLFLIGKNLRTSGVYNNPSNLSSLDDGDIAHTIDFRNVYQDVITEWLQRDASEIISRKFDTLGII